VIEIRRIEILDPAMVEVLRGKTPTERVAMVFDANRTMREMLLAHLREQHPERDQERIDREIA